MWRGVEEMRAEPENMFPAPSSGGQFHPAGIAADRMLPVTRGAFRVDAREHEEELIVVADLDGVERRTNHFSCLTREPLRQKVNAKEG